MDHRGQILNWIKEILQKNFEGINYTAFIFGSQANCMQLKRSDIDIGIIAETPISIQKMCSLNDAIEELPMLYEIDIVDFNTVDEKFRAVALRNIEPLL
jgi:predicted nucleotidyltransferase